MQQPAVRLKPCAPARCDDSHDSAADSADEGWRWGRGVNDIVAVYAKRRCLECGRQLRAGSSHDGTQKAKVPVVRRNKAGHHDAEASVP